MKNGLEHFVFRELSVMTECGHSVSIFTTKYKRGLYNPLPEWNTYRWQTLQVVLMQILFFLRSPGRYLHTLRIAHRHRAYADMMLAWYFAEKLAQTDVIYSTFGDHKLFIGYFAKLITGKPLVVTIHAYELYDNPIPALFVEALAACDQIITVTEHNREVLLQQYGVNPNKIQVVRINVNMDDYRPEKKFVILIVAFFTERKGHEILFQAVRDLNQEDLEVWVVGSTSNEDRSVDVEQLAKELGISHQVAFFGAMKGNALKALYRACDVFCLPSRVDSRGRKEGFPTVIAEAMAFAKPVISTRHVEIPRVLDRVLVDENDVAGLAQAIREVYASASLRASLGQENRIKAETLFSTRNARRAAEIFQQVALNSPSEPTKQPALAE